MRFYGKGLVWNQETGKICARFKEGVYDTIDPATIDFLARHGYEQDENSAPEKMTEVQEAAVIVAETQSDADEIMPEAPTAEEPARTLETTPRKELMALAKAAGIPKPNNQTNDALIKALRGE